MVGGAVAGGAVVGGAVVGGAAGGGAAGGGAVVVGGAGAVVEGAGAVVGDVMTGDRGGTMADTGAAPELDGAGDAAGTKREAAAFVGPATTAGAVPGWTLPGAVVGVGWPVALGTTSVSGINCGVSGATRTLGGTGPSLTVGSMVTDGALPGPTSSSPPGTR